MSVPSPGPDLKSICEELTGRALVGLNSLVCDCARPCWPGPCGKCLSCENFPRRSAGESSHLPGGPREACACAAVQGCPPCHLCTHPRLSQRGRRWQCMRHGFCLLLEVGLQPVPAGGTTVCRERARCRALWADRMEPCFIGAESGARANKRTFERARVWGAASK